MGRDWRFLLYGGVKVEITGQNLERFYNIAAQRGVCVKNIRMDRRQESGENEVTFWTTPSEFKKLKSLVRKTDTKVRIQGRYGFPFFLYRNRGRKMLAVGCLSFFLLLYVMSFFIWDISFEGNLRFTDETLLNYMESMSIVYGVKKSDISSEALETEIRNEFTEITWVSAEIKGTRLIVRVKENEALLEAVEPDTSPCDLVAEKAGEIMKTVTRSGFCQVKAGDMVEKGDLLVDGTIPIYDDSETLVNSHEIHADAEIYAKTVYTYQTSLPIMRTVKARTDRVRYGLYLEILGNTFYFLMPSYSENPWEFVMEQEQVKIFEDFYLPIYIGKVKAYEYVPYERSYSEEEVNLLAQSYLDEYMEKLSEKGIQILGSDGKIEQGESEWQIEGIINVIEDIASEIPAVLENQEEI